MQKSQLITKMRKLSNKHSQKSSYQSKKSCHCSSLQSSVIIRDKSQVTTQVKSQVTTQVKSQVTTQVKSQVTTQVKSQVIS